METKSCSKCGETKPLDEFSKDKSTTDGRQYRCKPCNAAYHRANRQRVSERGRAYREANRDRIAEYREANKERRAATRLAYNIARRDENNAYARRYHAENREQIAAKDARYRAENPHVAWESQYRLRAKKYGFTELVETMETFTRNDLIARHGDACFHCGGEWTEADHFPVPVSRGGRHSLNNAVPSCMTCNRRSWREAPTA